MGAKIKFDLEAGALMRNEIRAQLNRWKADIQYIEPDAIVNITESKGFLESYFTFRASNLSNNSARALQNCHDKLIASYDEE